MTLTANCLRHADLPDPTIKSICTQCIAEVQGDLIGQLQEAAELLVGFRHRTEPVDWQRRSDVLINKYGRANHQ